jgi:general secretion pathway protein L
MLAELITWWATQMGELLTPARWRTAQGAGDALLLEASPDGAWHLARRRNGATVPIAELSADATEDAWRRAFAGRGRWEPVFIGISRAFLRRQTNVPAAALANVHRFLTYEIDRLTPFAATDVVFAHRVRSRDAQTGQARVELALIPRVWIQDAVRRLAAIAIRPDAVEAMVAPGETGSVDRIPLDHDSRARARLLSRAAAVVCVVLMITAVGVLFIQQSLALAAVETRAAELRPRMREVETLRKRIAASSADTGQIAAARVKAASVLQVLGLLTDLMPDNTWLTALAFRDNRVTIEGRSAAANRLISTMAAEPKLKNPAFGAPVVRGGDGADIFTIQAGFGAGS